MNILFASFNENWHVDVLSGLSDKCNAKKVVSFSTINHCIDSKDCEYKWIDSNPFYKHKHDMNSRHIMPDVDEKVLNELASCERMYMKMLDRAEVLFSRKISYEERKSFYYQDLQELMFFLNETAFDLCVFSNIPHISFDYLLYSLCKVMHISISIAYQGMIVPGVSVTSYFMKDYKEPFPELNGIKYRCNEHNVELPPRVQACIDYYDRDKKDIKTVLDYADFWIEPERRSYWRLILNRFNEGRLLSTIMRKLHRQYECIRRKRFFNKNCEKIDLNADYIYFPLHFQPECTSVPMGGVYGDQFLIINQISSLLPTGKWLYVKPHPFNSYVDEMPLYKHILTLPNVKLINPHDNTYDLIDNCAAVASITGTVICESLVRGKPAMMYGYYMWQYAPGVFACREWEDCKKAIEKIFETRELVKRVDLIAFLRDVDKYLYTGSLFESTLKMFKLSKEENINNMIEGYYENIKSQGLLS